MPLIGAQAGEGGFAGRAWAGGKQSRTQYAFWVTTISIEVDRKSVFE